MTKNKVIAKKTVSKQWRHHARACDVLNETQKSLLFFWSTKLST